MAVYEDIERQYESELAKIREAASSQREKIKSQKETAKSQLSTQAEIQRTQARQEIGKSEAELQQALGFEREVETLQERRRAVGLKTTPVTQVETELTLEYQSAQRANIEDISDQETIGLRDIESQTSEVLSDIDFQEREAIADLNKQRQKAIDARRIEYENALRVAKEDESFGLVIGGLKDTRKQDTEIQLAKLSKYGNETDGYDIAKFLYENPNDGQLLKNVGFTDAQIIEAQRNVSLYAQEAENKRFFEATHVKLSTGEYILKTDYDRLPLRQQTYLMNYGVDAYNSYDFTDKLSPYGRVGHEKIAADYFIEMKKSGQIPESAIFKGGEVVNGKWQISYETPENIEPEISQIQTIKSKVDLSSITPQQDRLIRQLAVYTGKDYIEAARLIQSGEVRVAQDIDTGMFALYDLNNNKLPIEYISDDVQRFQEIVNKIMQNAKNSGKPIKDINSLLEAYKNNPELTSQLDILRRKIENTVKDTDFKNYIPESQFIANALELAGLKDDNSKESIQTKEFARMNYTSLYGTKQAQLSRIAELPSLIPSAVENFAKSKIDTVSNPVVKDIAKLASGFLTGVVIREISLPLTAASIVATGAMQSDIATGLKKSGQLALDYGKGIVTYFMTLPAQFALDPYFTSGELYGMFKGIKGAVKDVNTVRAWVDPYGLPARAIGIEFSTGRLKVENMTPEQKGYTAQALHDATVKVMQGDLGGTIKVGDVTLKYRGSPIQQVYGDVLFSSTPDKTPFMKDTVFVNKGGLYTDVYAAERFLASAKGDIPTKPAVIAVLTEASRINTDIPIDILKKASQNDFYIRGADEGFYGASKTYAGAYETEVVGAEGTQLYKTPTSLRSRILGKGAGDFFVQYSGKSMGNLADGDLVPVITLADKGIFREPPSPALLYAVKLLTLKETLIDFGESIKHPIRTLQDIIQKRIGAKGVREVEIVDIADNLNKEAEKIATKEAEKTKTESEKTSTYNKAYEKALADSFDKLAKKYIDDNLDVENRYRDSVGSRDIFEDIYKIRLAENLSAMTRAYIDYNSIRDINYAYYRPVSERPTSKSISERLASPEIREKISEISSIREEPYRESITERPLTIAAREQRIPTRISISERLVSPEIIERPPITTVGEIRQPIKETPTRETPIRETPIKETPIRETPIRETQIPPIETPPKIIKLPDGTQKRFTQEQWDSRIAWKQGFIYWLIWKPYQQGRDEIATREPIEGVKYFSGIGSAAKSVISKGLPPEILQRTMGFEELTFETRPAIGAKPKLTFKKRYTPKRKSQRSSNSVVSSMRW